MMNLRDLSIKDGRHEIGPSGRIEVEEGSDGQERSAVRVSRIAASGT